MTADPVMINLYTADVVLAVGSADAVVREGLPRPVGGHPLELVVEA